VSLNFIPDGADHCPKNLAAGTGKTKATPSAIIFRIKLKSISCRGTIFAIMIDLHWEHSSVLPSLLVPIAHVLPSFPFMCILEQNPKLLPESTVLLKFV
jgi:hypothetical protein